MKKMLRYLLVTVLCVSFLTGCNSQKGSNEKMNSIKPIATIELEDGNKIVLELYPEMAPNTVNNFITLANSGFYDGVVFHRAVPGFMIQGGDPTGTGTGGPGYSISGEFASNGFSENTLSHTEGVISMARSASPNSAGSQFFIVTGNASFLDRQYAAFGKVIEGYEHAVRISELPTQNELLKEQVKIKTITVDTFGVEVPPVQKMK